VELQRPKSHRRIGIDQVVPAETEQPTQRVARTEALASRAVLDRVDATEVASRRARRPATLRSRRTSTSPTSQPRSQASWWHAPAPHRS